jgi:hypothetical protein
MNDIWVYSIWIYEKYILQDYYCQIVVHEVCDAQSIFKTIYHKVSNDT